MSETRHTPGPWSWEIDALSSKPIALCSKFSERDVLYVAGSGTGAFARIAEVDARLIAACPRMYDFIMELAEGGNEEARAILAEINASGK